MALLQTRTLLIMVIELPLHLPILIQVKKMLALVLVGARVVFGERIPSVSRLLSGDRRIYLVSLGKWDFSNNPVGEWCFAFPGAIGSRPFPRRVSWARCNSGWNFLDDPRLHCMGAKIFFLTFYPLPSTFYPLHFTQSFCLPLLSLLRWYSYFGRS